jgi:hypothetical protein
MYFASKDPDYSVVVQVRDMVNGYPGVNCYAEVVLTPDQINVSPKGETATVVSLNQPVYCKAGVQYCFTILSDSALYQMYMAELGQKDLITGNYVTSQPYLAGVLFSSSNALTWTAHQTKDLKFDLYQAYYTGNAQILFSDVQGVTVSRILLASQVLDHKNKGVEWFYKIGDSTVWLPIETYVDRDLSSTASKISIKLVMHADPNSSPMIAADSLNLIGFLEQTEGTYVSRQIQLDENFTKARVICDFALPSNTGARVFIMANTAGTWTELTSPTISRVDDEFSRYEYNLTGLSSKTYRVKVVLSTSNPLIRPRARKLMSILKV